MTDVFEMDVHKLKQLNVRSSGQTTHASHVQSENEIKKELHRRTLLKFAMLCRKLNVNPLHEKSIHVILLLFCKVRDKEKLLEGFLTHPTCRGLDDIHVDWRMMNDVDVDINNIFCAMSDWIYILNYLAPNVEPELADSLWKDQLFVRLRNSWSVGGLETYYPATVERFMTVCVYMAPQNLSATKMLERLLVGEGSSCRDLEFRCLRTTSNFLDMPIDEQESLLNVLQVVPCMITKPTFFSDMKNVLTKDVAVAEDQSNAMRSNRLQMRFVSKTVPNTNNVYTESFDSWLGQQKFINTMSKHLQLLLYFVQVQTIEIPMETYAVHFTEHMLGRIKNVKVQNIDASAVIKVISSLRVYHHNVADLLDFRATCLSGFNQHIRVNLSLAQIFQLYVSAFQHSSILQACWKAVVPVWTHTTASAVKRFTESHTFDYAPVIDSVIRCQVQD